MGLFAPVVEAGGGNRWMEAVGLFAAGTNKAAIGGFSGGQWRLTAPNLLSFRFPVALA